MERMTQGLLLALAVLSVFVAGCSHGDDSDSNGGGGGDGGYAETASEGPAPLTVRDSTPRGPEPSAADR